MHTNRVDKTFDYSLYENIKKAFKLTFILRASNLINVSTLDIYTLTCKLYI